MTYSPLLIVHIGGGIMGLLSGSAAMVVRKGSRLHKRAGDVFVISMLAMGASGAYLALMKGQTTNIFAGILTFYLVLSAWLTARRREKQTGIIDWVALLVALAVGIALVNYGFEAAHSRTGLKDGVPAAMYFVMASVALLCATGDLRMLVRGGVAGTQRLTRHLWRMGFALFIAAGSFFLGSASKTGLRAQLFTAAIRRTHLPEVPVILIILLIIFWLVRVRFANAYKKKPAPGSGDVHSVAA
jgi:uncharacterized membrane protein